MSNQTNPDPSNNDHITTIVTEIVTRVKIQFSRQSGASVKLIGEAESKFQDLYGEDRSGRRRDVDGEIITELLHLHDNDTKGGELKISFIFREKDLAE